MDEKILEELVKIRQLLEEQNQRRTATFDINQFREEMKKRREETVMRQLQMIDNAPVPDTLKNMLKNLIKGGIE